MKKACPRCRGYGRVKMLGGIEKTCPVCDGERGFEIKQEEDLKETKTETQKEVQTEKPKSKSSEKRKKTQKETKKKT